MKHKITGFLVLFFILGCSSDLDFDQVNDLNVAPVVVANFATFEVQANQFVTGGIEQPLFTTTTNFEIFNDSFFYDNTQRVDFYFELSNTINRAYTIDIVLLDNTKTPLHTIKYAIPAYTGGTNLITSTAIFQNTKLDLLKKTVELTFTINMLPGTILSETSTGILKLRSSATVYLVVQ